MLNRVSCASACQRACVLAWFTCQHICVPTCLKATNFSFLRAIRRANVSTWCANVRNSMPIFPLGVATCQKTYQLFKYVSYIKIVLYFITILHVILKKSVWNFCFFIFFCSLVRVSQGVNIVVIFLICDLLELEIRDSYKKPYCDYVFSVF